jgi:serine/threonine protein phosphatase PrpC
MRSINGPLLPAVVFDGHGGEDSAKWLQQELHKDVVARIERNMLATDAAGEPVPGKPFLTKPRLASKVLTDVFHSVDDRLCNKLRGEHEMTSVRGVGRSFAVEPVKITLKKLMPY